MADARDPLRARTPPGYRWWRHVALIALFTASGAWLAWERTGGLGAADWTALAGMLLVINLGEYASHRWHMHVPRFPRAVHQRHVIEHHAFFGADSMGIEGWDDLRWVLFPPWALPLLVATVLPLFVALRWLAGARAAWLLVLAVIVYYGAYEVLHAVTHLPPAHPLARTRLVRAVTAHHRLHHDPALMDRYNFNFALPLFDWAFGTRLTRPPAEPELVRGARRSG